MATYQMTDAVGVGKAIRATLKAHFPHTTFRVRKQSYESVTIDWEDGPTSRQVNDLVGQHEYGHFDGMIDLYEYSNRRDDIPQCKYVQTHRELSEAAWVATLDWMNATFRYGLEYERDRWGNLHVTNDRYEHGNWLSNDIHRYGWRFPLLCPDHQHRILLTDKFCPECGCEIPRHDPNDSTYA